MDLVLLRRRMRRPRQSGGLAALRFALVGISAIVLSSLLFVFTGVAGAYSLYASYIQDLPSADEIGQLSVQQFETTRLYDRTGQVVLYEIIPPEGHRTAVSLDQIPEYLQQATVAMEDRTFYTNPGGINVRGIGRAVWGIVRGEDEGGGSSITQQLVRNVIMSYEERIKRSYSRKLKEMVLAIELTRRYPGVEGRNRILEWYLNTIPYGRMAIGVEAAAQVYFSKHVEDLTLAEAAMLVPLPNAPALNPIDRPKEAKDRQELVLDEMYLQGYITAAEAYAAKQEPIAITPLDNTMVAPHYVVYARRVLEDTFGVDAVNGGGLQVITSVDLSVQDEVTRLTQERIGDLREQHNANDAAVVVVDVKTAEVLAILGSVDYSDERSGQVNMALSPRQPGSSIKPIVYATAFAQGLTPATMVMDVRTSFPDPPNPPYVPENYSRRYSGPMTLRRALAGSYNIPAVAVLDQVGIENAVNMAHALGITDLEEAHHGLSLALGGYPVKLLDMVYAFGVFANGGSMLGAPVPAENQTPGMRTLDPVVLLKVSDAKGNVLYEYDEPERRNILSPEVAYLISDVLSDNGARTPVFGPNSPMYVPDRPTAVKTGTTNDFYDGWTVGYTPQYAVGVWVGNTEHIRMRNADGSRVAAPIWRAVMDWLHRDLPVETFQRPPGIVTVTVDSTSGKLPTEFSPAQIQEVFIAGTEPTEVDDVHQGYSICRETGLIATPYCPPDLVETRVYAMYPAEAEDWVRDEGIPQPPREHCALHGPNLASLPVSITSPRQFDRLNGVVAITGNARPEGLERFSLQYGAGMAPSEWTPIGGERGDMVDNDILQLWDTAGLGGLYTLQLNAVAFGSVQTFSVQVMIDGTPPSVTVLSPRPGDRFVPGRDEWISIHVSAVDDTAMDRVEFYMDGIYLGYSTVAPYTKRWNLKTGPTPEHTFDLPAPIEEQIGDEFHRKEVVVEGDRTVYIHTVQRDGQLLKTTRVSRGPDGGIAWEVIGADGQLLSSSAGAGAAGPHTIWVVAYDAAGNRVETPPIEIHIGG
jgi:penicillin-binding protein 1C